MLFYEYVSEFNVRLNALDYIVIALWIAVIILHGYMVILFHQDAKKLNKLFNFIALFFLLFIGSRICRLIAKFIVGEPTGGATAISGNLLILQICYNMFSYIGLFFLYLTLERSILKKTHYLFCILVIITIVLSFIQYVADILFIIVPFYAVILLGLPIVFIKLAMKTSGSIRKNSLMVALGMLLYELGIIFDIPEASPVWSVVPGLIDIVRIIAPIAQIAGIYFVRKGFPREI